MNIDESWADIPPNNKNSGAGQLNSPEGAAEPTFEQSVLRWFSFLIDEYGLCVTQRIPGLLQFESPTAYLVISIDHGIELELGIGVRPPGSDKYSDFPFEELLKLAGVNERSRYYVSDPSVRDRLIAGLATLVRDHAGELFTKDPTNALSKLLEKRREIAGGTVPYDIEQMRIQAERAWQTKSLVVLRRLYESMGDYLTPVESKRLAYARKKTAIRRPTT